MPPKTRNQSGGIDPAVVFPIMPSFIPMSQLPTIKSVIGVLQSLTAGGSAKTSHKDATREVAKLVYAKWYHDTVYCIALNGIVRKLDKMWDTFREGRKRFASGRESGKAIDEYRKIAEHAEKLFDVGATTTEQSAKCKEEWGVTMTEAEHNYYADQKTERKMDCDKQVDPVWYWSVMRKERQRAREEEYRRQRAEQFQFKDIDDITEILRAEMGGVSSSDVSVDSPDKCNNTVTTEHINNKKRKLFVEVETDDSEFPSYMAHVRDSERKVKDQLYLTISALSGRGMSLSECCNAVVEVANGMFGRQWKLPDINSEVFDMDTLPDIRNIRSKLQLVEAETLSMVVSSISEAKESGRAITASIDSTTKRGVGQFATQVIQIGQNCPVPMPLIGISGETTEEVALQMIMQWRFLQLSMVLRLKKFTNWYMFT